MALTQSQAATLKAYIAGIPEWARSTVGQPYDWTGVFAIPFRERDWQAPGRWYGSEHMEAALARSGAQRWRPGMHGISPCQSYYNAG